MNCNYTVQQSIGLCKTIQIHPRRNRLLNIVEHRYSGNAEDQQCPVNTMSQLDDKASLAEKQEKDCKELHFIRKGTLF